MKQRLCHDEINGIGIGPGLGIGIEYWDPD